MENFKEKITAAYLDQLLIQGKRPHSIYAFMKEMNEEEGTFYDSFNSFDSIEKSIWISIFTSTIDTVKAQEVYESYSVREKFLSFCFTLVETLKKRRSYVSHVFGNLQCHKNTLSGGKDVFSAWSTEILNEGLETQEVQERPYISNKYDEALWAETIALIRFWVKDDSDRFEKTDEFIEKAANLSFDLIGKTVVDSAFEFSKFLFQQR